MIKLQITKGPKMTATGPTNFSAYYYRVIVNDNVTISDIASTIAKRCTVQRADCEACIVAFCQVIRELLLQSCSVKLNKVGSFRLSVASMGSATPEEVTVSNIKKIKTLYLPDTGIKYWLDLSRVSFSVVNPPATTDEGGGA